ncbi:hypothetical protein BpHYR1_047880 [Brachionus plicatilis]|uniref:Uncharacterized protein n=1 Tax=Brachionus plicatilis TaxID=10195 RepID=A0A3M7T934_BRAPC|nr:hypothetical protein BpHYR1_047880 [Brachionus plicatilis]
MSAKNQQINCAADKFFNGVQKIAESFADFYLKFSNWKELHNSHCIQSRKLRLPAFFKLGREKFNSLMVKLRKYPARGFIKF